MELPNELKVAIEKNLEKISTGELAKHSENISLKYRNEERNGKKLLTLEAEALSYSAVRMPATYGAIYTALRNTLQICNIGIETLLDVGAGTGAGTWAASDLLELKHITCLERENVMMNIGKSLMENSTTDVIKNANWKQLDVVKDDITETADLVICSYVLNEIPEKERYDIVEKLWKATNKILIILEPGTPIGFKEIKQIRGQLINSGAYLLAPCPNSEECKMIEDDWCHATCRIARSKVHKFLKKGDVPYEDEKFSYIAVSKSKFDINNIARVLRHPKIEEGRISLEICTKDGIRTKVVTKKDKEMFKKARKVKCGDMIVLE